MKNRVNVRSANLSDLDFLLPNVYISEKVLRHKIDFEEFVLAEKKREPVGFLELEYLWSQTPFISLIRVNEECRREGIGRELLTFTEIFLSKRKHEMLYSSSQEDEIAPQEWHKHVGFKECGKIEGINEGVGEIFFVRKIRK